MKRSRVRAHLGAVEEAQARRRAPDGLRPRGRRLPARPAFRYVERPPQPPAATRRWTTSSTDSHQGYCQHFAGAMALMLRMAGIPARVATGFTPRRLLDPQEGLDRARHRRPRVGRGLVRRVRLGHDRPDAGRHARPLPGRRARARAAARAPRSADRDTGAATPRPTTRATRSPSAPSCSSAAATTDDRRRRRGRLARGCVWRARRARASRRSCSPCCCSSAARAARRRWTARSPRSRTRCGASGGRSPPARR